MSTPFVSIADIVAAVEETRAMGRGLRGLNTWAIDSIVADWHRLRAIEAAALEVLSAGQARDDAEEMHTGDLVPAATMQSLRDAVEGHRAPTPRRETRPSTDVIADLLSLVEVYVSAEDVAQWTEIQREQATEWASAVHLAASDNDDVVVPERPTFLPVEGEGTKPPVATAQVLRAAVHPDAAMSAVNLIPRDECADCAAAEEEVGPRGMCDRHFDALVDLLRRA